MWLEWSLNGPFQNCARLLCHPFKMAAVTKNRYFFNCLFCFILSQNELTFKLHLHEYKLFNMSSWFFREIFLSSYLYWLCIFLYKKITLKSSASESFAEMNLGYTLSKLCVTSTLHSRRLPLEISLNWRKKIN